MKKIFLALAVFAMTTNIQAQNNKACANDSTKSCCKVDANHNKGDHHKGHKPLMAPKTPAERTKRMAERLNLNADQQAKVLKLNEEYAAFLSPVRKPGYQKSEVKQPEDGKKQFNEMRQKRNEYRQKLAEILTPEQREKMQQMHHRHHRQGQGGAHSEKK